MSLGDEIQFAYEAMRDARDTIRAIDFKANALLVVLAISGASIDKLAGAASFILANSVSLAHFWWLAVAIAGAFSWLISLAAACLILAGKYNPAQQIADREGATGILFSPGAFAMSIWWIPLWPQSTPASLKKHEALMALSDATILREVCFEHLKLVYIRENKSMRLRLALITGFISFILLGALWASAVFLGFGSKGSS